ncbi:MAG: universal stress protein [Crocinitomicaceae bacterium]|nr:universal stress protein [Crocinitomicaceae bacterium]
MKKQIKKILIPTDYSTNARRATNFGLELAKKLQAEVLLFHSYHFPLTSSEDMVYVAQMKEGEVQKLEDERKVLENKFGGVKIEVEVEYGSAVDLIQSISQREAIDLIIMGTKGETNGVDAVLGSVASNVINNVKSSVLVIPEETREFKIEEIVLATDFHQLKGDHFFGPLLYILDKTGAAVSIVNVKPNISFEDVPSKQEISIGNVFSDYKYSHHFLEGENIEEALFDYAHLNESDMIVILTKHYTLWEKIWHKSMAKKLALHTTIPLFIIHEDA